MTDTANVLVVGEGPVASALAPMVSAAGWTPLPATSMEEVEAGLGDADAVVVLSHHEGLDGPAIKAALEQGTAYVGAMGSRKTQERRREWLLANGVDEAALAMLRAPIGLDIGADEPGEIAVVDPGRGRRRTPWRGRRGRGGQRALRPDPSRPRAGHGHLSRRLTATAPYWCTGDQNTATPMLARVSTNSP